MVKIVIKSRTSIVKSRDAEWNAERKAVRAMSDVGQSVAFRETKAANIPVTYVSGNVIIREHNGKTTIIGHTAPRIKVRSSK